MLRNSIFVNLSFQKYVYFRMTFFKMEYFDVPTCHIQKKNASVLNYNKFLIKFFFGKFRGNRELGMNSEFGYYFPVTVVAITRISRDFAISHDFQNLWRF
jgi:hypothetical protein